MWISRLILGLSLVFSLVVAEAQEFTILALKEGTGRMVTPVELVSKPTCLFMNWDRFGDFLYYVTMEVKPGSRQLSKALASGKAKPEGFTMVSRLSIWDHERAKSTTILERDHPIPGATIDRVGKSRTFLISVPDVNRAPSYKVYSMDTLRLTDLEVPTDCDALAVSNQYDLAMWRMADHKSVLVYSGGKLSKFVLPINEEASFIDFATDGKSIVVWLKGETNAPSHNWAVNMQSGQIVRGEFVPAIMSVTERDASLELGYEDEGKGIDGERQYKLYLYQDILDRKPDIPAHLANAHVQVTSGVGKALLSESGTHLAFTSQGSLFVCEILPVTKEFVTENLNRESKTQTMNRAKQVALSLLMFAGDMDDVLPTTDRLQDVMPYLKEQSILNGFVYDYSGERNMTKIDNPADTALGYMPGTGGRAVVYADGHVKWIPDKP